LIGGAIGAVVGGLGGALVFLLRKKDTPRRKRAKVARRREEYDQDEYEE
jgi:hypothetical protein